MFEPVSKSGSDEHGDRRKATLIGDISGAFGDLGTFLPLVVGLLVVGRFDPTGLLIGFGLFALATGAIYRLPIPVQPMKAVAALGIAGGLSAADMAASGLLLGAALLALGASGLIGHLRRLVPNSILIGLQLGLALHLLLAGIDLAGSELSIAAAALASMILLQMTPFRALGCLLLVAGSIIWSLADGERVLPPFEMALHLPAFVLPSWSAVGAVGASVFWPQLALTLTNAVLLTSVLAADYFPKDKTQTSPKKLALSTGGLNLLLMPIGAMPMCHGAGGLAAQYHQGARTGLAPAIFGTLCLTLGLLAGPAALDWLLLVPPPAIAALLAFAGLHLVRPKRLVHLHPSCLAIIALTALTAVLIDIAMGLAAGLIAELLRSAIRAFRQPTT